MRASQAGVALPTGLVLLCAMSVLGLAAARTALVEQRMTGGFEDAQAASAAAEAALQEGERRLQQPALPAFDGSAGLYPAPAANAPPRWRSLDWDSGAVIAYDGLVGAPGALRQLRVAYFIEELPAASAAAIDESGTVPRGYRITARATRISTGATTTLQTVVRR